MLHDLMPDIVTVSFGARTKEIHSRLQSRGWKFVGLGDWQGERVLGVSFGGDRRATRTADDLLAALIAVVGEMEIAETRSLVTPRVGSPLHSPPTQKGRPRSAKLRGLFLLTVKALGLLGLQRLLRSRLLAAADVDLPRLHRLGDLADQLDREQAVLQVRAAHLDMVGKREAPLERAGGDPAIDVVGAAVLELLVLLAG